MYSSTSKAISQHEIKTFLGNCTESYVSKGSNGYTTKHTLRPGYSTTILNAYTNAPIQHLLVKHVPYKTPNAKVLGNRQISIGERTFNLKYSPIDSINGEFEKQFMIFWKSYPQQVVPMPLLIEKVSDVETPGLVEGVDVPGPIRGWTPSPTTSWSPILATKLTSPTPPTVPAPSPTTSCSLWPWSCKPPRASARASSRATVKAPQPLDDTGMINIVMEYIETPREINNSDIPAIRGLMVLFTQMGYLHGDFNPNNCMIHPGGGKEFIIFIDFGTTVMIDPGVIQVLNSYFGNWDAALRSPHAFHYIFLANMFVPYIISTNGCFSQKDNYSLYQYLISGSMSAYDTNIKCFDEEIDDIDFDSFFMRTFDVTNTDRTIPSALVMPADPGYPVNNDLSHFMAVELPPKYKASGGRRSRRRRQSSNDLTTPNRPKAR